MSLSTSLSMRKIRFKQSVGAWAAIAVLVVQPQCLFAAERSIVKASTTANASRTLTVVDVALQNDGLLRGQFVDKQGQPLSAAEIQITDGHKQWRAETDANGQFQLTKLSGATYRLQVGQQVQILRAWADGTAPPSATKGLLLVRDGDIILAQNCGSPVCGSAIRAAKHPLANPWIIGGLVAAAIAIPVAIHNSDDDDPPATP